MEIDNSPLWKSTLFALTTVIVVQLLYLWYKVRSRIYRLQKMGLAMPPWNWITGHFTFIRAYSRRYPSDVLAGIILMDLYRDYFTKSEMFYLDLWPIAAPTLVVCNPNASYDVNRKLNIKPDMYVAHFDPQSGGPSLLSTNGISWKYWRSLLNPGFSPGYLAGKVCDVVDGAEIFGEILHEHSICKDIFQLENATMRLTMETIFKVILNDDLNYQRVDHPVPKAMRKILLATGVRRLSFDQLNPVRAVSMWKCNRVINYHFVGVITRLYQEMLTDPGKVNKSMMSIAMTSYISQRYPEGPPNQLDPAFIREAVPQLRMLLIASDDTTTSILVYCYHLLAKNPDSLEKLRKEHMEVFGADPSNASSILRSSDGAKYLSRLPYTSGIIKEALRLYPPGGAIRAGSPTVQLSDPTGILYPTEGCQVALQHHAIHRNARIYPHPDKFDPDRWLKGEAAVKGAFRPFEHGARSCIGQDVAYMLLKIALVITARKFSIHPAYEEFQQNRANDLALSSGEISKVHGECAYQTENGGAHPALSYPCRVEAVSN